MFHYKLRQPIEARKVEIKKTTGKKRGRGVCSKDQSNRGGGGLERAIRADFVAFRELYVRQLIEINNIDKNNKPKHQIHHYNNKDNNETGTSFQKFKQIVWKDGNFQLVFQLHAGVDGGVIPSHCHQDGFFQMLYSVCLQLLADALLMTGTCSNRGRTAACHHHKDDCNIIIRNNNACPLVSNEAAFAVYMLYALYEVNPRDSVRALRKRANAAQARINANNNNNVSNNTYAKNVGECCNAKKRLTMCNMEWLSLLPLNLKHDYGTSKFHRRAFRAPIRIGQAEFVMLQRVRDLAMEGMALCEVHRMEADFGISTKQHDSRCSTNDDGGDGDNFAAKKESLSSSKWQCSCSNARDVLEIINRMQYNECFDLCEYSGPGTLEGFVGNDPDVFIKMDEAASVSCFPCASHHMYASKGDSDAPAESPIDLYDSTFDWDGLKKSFQLYTKSLHSIHIPVTTNNTSRIGGAPSTSKQVALIEKTIAPLRSELSGYQWCLSLDRLQEMSDVIRRADGKRGRILFAAEVAKQKEAEIENFKRLREGKGADFDYSRHMMLKRRFGLGERGIFELDGAMGILPATSDAARNSSLQDVTDDYSGEAINKEEIVETEAVPFISIGESISEMETEGILSALNNITLEEESSCEKEEGGSSADGQILGGQSVSKGEKTEVESLASSVPHAGADALQALIAEVSKVPSKPPKRRTVDNGYGKSDEETTKKSSKKQRLGKKKAASANAQERDESLSLASSIPFEGANAIKTLLEEVNKTAPKDSYECGGEESDNGDDGDDPKELAEYDTKKRAGRNDTEKRELMEGDGSVSLTSYVPLHGANALKRLLLEVSDIPSKTSKKKKKKDGGKGESNNVKSAKGGTKSENMHTSVLKTKVVSFEKSLETSKRKSSSATTKIEEIEENAGPGNDNDDSILSPQLVGASALGDLLGMVGKDPPGNKKRLNLKTTSKGKVEKFSVAVKRDFASAEEDETIQFGDHLMEDEELASLFSLQMSGRTALLDLLSRVKKTTPSTKRQSLSRKQINSASSKKDVETQPLPYSDNADDELVSATSLTSVPGEEGQQLISNLILGVLRDEIYKEESDRDDSDGDLLDVSTATSKKLQDKEIVSTNSAGQPLAGQSALKSLLNAVTNLAEA